MCALHKTHHTHIHTQVLALGKAQEVLDAKLAAFRAYSEQALAASDKSQTNIISNRVFFCAYTRALTFQNFLEGAGARCIPQRR